jgi:hypothetical protein
VNLPDIDIDIGGRVKKEPPAWGARYIAGNKPPLANPGPFPSGIAANIIGRGGKLNNGDLLDLNAMANLPVKGGGTLLDVAGGFGKGGNPFDNIVKADISSNGLGNLLGNNGNGKGNGKDNILSAVVGSGLLSGGKGNILDAVVGSGNNGNGKGKGHIDVGAISGGKGKSGK